MAAPRRHAGFSAEEAAALIQDDLFGEEDDLADDADEDYNPKDDEDDDESDRSVEDVADLVQRLNTPDDSAINIATSPPRKRHKPARKDGWKCNISKKKRVQGLAYQSRTGCEKPARTMGPPCDSTFCKKSKLRGCDGISPDQRTRIHSHFWAMSTWAERKTYVKTLIQKCEVKQKTTGSGSRRQVSLSYCFNVEGRLIQVCSSFFSSTLGISKRTLHSWLSTEEAPDVESEHSGRGHLAASASNQSSRSPKSGPRAAVSAEDFGFLKSWLLDLPTVPSHYCRNIPAYKDKRFLYPGTLMSDLYAQYIEAAGANGKRCVSLTYFRQTMSNLRISVFLPRKDQCDLCVSAKQGNAEPAKYATHIRGKQEAREEKERDKERACDEVSVWTMDVQAVLLCPRTKASALYYKTKLQVHNFTFYNLKTKEGFCYAWDETDGDLSSEVFACIQYHHFEAYLDSHPEVKTLIVWSDGCGYQNKNTNASNAYIHLSKTKGIVIEQKYLVSGHTQMECDSMHSTIERQIVGDVFTPRDYVVLMQNARKKPFPYTVTQLAFSDMRKMSDHYISAIRPGRVSGDATVSEIRALHYEPTPLVQYKLKFHAAWQALPQRITHHKNVSWVPLFLSRLPIKQRKFKDLQALKHVIPKNLHAFFDSLPHSP